RRESPTSVGTLLDPSGRKFAEVATHRAVRSRGALHVVLRPSERELTVPRRPRGAPVAVERHSGAARVDEVGAVRAGAAELKMAVTEDDRPVADSGEQPLLTLLRLGGKAIVIGERRAVDVEDPIELGLRRQRV